MKLELAELRRPEEEPKSNSKKRAGDVLQRKGQTAETVGGRGSFHKVGVFKFLSPSQAPAFWECPVNPEQSKLCPCLSISGNYSQPFCVCSTTSSVKSGESFIPGIPLRHVLSRPP